MKYEKVIMSYATSQWNYEVSKSTTGFWKIDENIAHL